MAKKKNAMPEATLDKMDDYLKNNYMKIIIAAAAVLLAFLLFHGFKQVKESTRLKSEERVGSLENAGFQTAEQVLNYTELAGKGELADYVHFTSAVYLSLLGETAMAADEAGRTGGDFASYAESLSYELEGGTGAVSVSQLSGDFSPLWYYRAVLSGVTLPDANATAPNLMEEFRAAWPDSFLLEQLVRWGY